jgi:hypothetical protein
MAQFDLEAALERAKRAIQSPPPPPVPQPTGDRDRDYAAEQHARMLQTIDQRAAAWSSYTLRVLEQVLAEFQDAQLKSQRDSGAVSMHVDDIVIQVHRRIGKSSTAP